MDTPRPLIPRPFAQRLRDFRRRFVPLLVYLTGVAAVVYLWNTQWMPSAFSGEVQSRLANMASPLEGVLLETSVRPFDRVTRGQVLGRVALSPAVATSRLATIRADLLVLRARMALDGNRNQVNYQQLRVDQLDQKVNLGIARSRLRFAESELSRQRNLRSQKIVSEFDYEVALDQRDALLAEIGEREELIAQLDRTLTSLKPTDDADGSSLVLDPIDAAINAQEEQFRQSAEAIIRSPIDGIVTRVYRNEGENIAAGELLITISSEHSESIIGFVRQPISFQPKPGDVVIVRTRRGTKRQAAEARIISIGGRLEFFSQPLRVRGFDSSQERGLPVLIEAPAELALYPGELVDLALKN